MSVEGREVASLYPVELLVLVTSAFQDGRVLTATGTLEGDVSSPKCSAFSALTVASESILTTDLYLPGVLSN